MWWKSAGHRLLPLQVVDAAATIGRFPYAAADWTEVSHDAAICGRGRIDCYGVHSPFGRRVIKTARTAGHPLRLRTECGEIGRTQREFGLAKLSFRCCPAGTPTAMRACCAAAARTHAGSKRPVGNVKRSRQDLFQLLKTGSFLRVNSRPGQACSARAQRAAAVRHLCPRLWRALHRIGPELIPAAHED